MIVNKQAEEAGRRADELLNQVLNGMGNTENKAPDEIAKVNVTAPVSAQEHQNTEPNWQQMYGVINGKYRAEVPQLHAQVRELQRQAAELQGQISAKEAELQAAKVVATPKGVAGQSVDGLRTMYGEDVAELFASLQAQNAEVQKQLADLQKTQTAQPASNANAPGDTTQGDPLSDQAYQYVVAQVGGQAAFEAIDNSPEFTAWLKEFDAMLGKTRFARMNELFDERRLNEVAQFFITFRDQQKRITAATVNDPREEMVQPSHSNASATPQQGKRIYLMSDIKKLQKDLTVNPKYRTLQGQADAAEIERELLLAMQEGRIREG